MRYSIEPLYPEDGWRKSGGGGLPKVIVFITDYQAVDQIIARLKLQIVAE